MERALVRSPGRLHCVPDLQPRDDPAIRARLLRLHRRGRLGADGPGNPRFRELLGLARKLYTRLKRDHPDLPVFIEFNLGDTAYMEERRDVIAALLPYTDLYTVSTYPAQYDQVFGHATRVPRDWFAKVSEFVTPWVVRDLDSLFTKLSAAGGYFAEPMWRLAQDTGLYDETGRPRRARAIWDAWLGLEYRKRRSGG